LGERHGHADCVLTQHLHSDGRANGCAHTAWHPLATASRTKGKRRKGAKGTAAKAAPNAAPMAAPTAAAPPMAAAPPAELERAALQQAVLRLASVRPAEASAAYASLRAEDRLALLLALMRAACDTQEPPLT
jgi:hypothetical protein